jgi:CDP-diacylglycerol--glycerol-3-phosphate 3-phosphatidyltransferase
VAQVALRSTFDTTISRVTTPIGHGLSSIGVTPNMLTTAGLVLTAVGAGFVVADQPVVGGLVLILGGLMDTFDGAVARATSSSTPFGGFYDSVVDRMSDGIILAAIAFWVRDMPRQLTATLIALVAAQVISYVRARAESIDLDCSIGIMERAERAIALMFGLVFHRWLLEPVLWLLAVGGIVTVVQRIHHVWCQVARDLPDELIALAAGDTAWNRAFLVAARRFYGSTNFDAALTDAAVADGRGTARPASGDR